MKACLLLSRACGGQCGGIPARSSCEGHLNCIGLENVIKERLTQDAVGAPGVVKDLAVKPGFSRQPSFHSRAVLLKVMM